MTERVLTPARAGRVYDRIGRLQDWQGFYERRPIADVIAHADFEHAESVYELGCGTGSTAAMLFEDHLPPAATYVGIDVSTKMVGLATRRLEPFGERARVEQVSGDAPLPGASGGFDRFVALYVFDLFSESLAAELLDEARRLLAPGGRLCLAGLTHGTTGPSRALCSVWSRVWRLAPAVVGGCRPVDLLDLLDGWHVEHTTTIVSWAVPSQVVIAIPDSPSVSPP